MIEFGIPLRDRTYVLRPGAYGVLADSLSRILVIEASVGTFYLPGGGIESNETAEQAVVREIMEETGLEVSCGRQFAAAAQFVHCLDEPNGYKKTCSFFLVEQVYDPNQTQGEYRTHWLDLEQAQGAVLEDAHKWAIGQVDVNINSNT